MKVLVTGGTGFVGSHTVAALVGAGHDVRMLVRSPAKVGPALKRHAVSVEDIVEGDVLDVGSLRAAVEGCEAILHAANVYSFDPRAVARMRQVNEEGTENVLQVAIDAGLDPVVYVSSYLAMVPGTEPQTPDSPVADPPTPYGASKAAGERIARRFQEQGAPVVISQPASVWGPDDPYIGESAEIAISALKGRYRFSSDGTLPVVDVRDVAAAHAAMIRPNLGGQRFLLAGHNPRFRRLIGRLGEVCERNLSSIRLPGKAVMTMGRTLEAIEARTGWNPLVGYEGPWILAHAVACDASRAEQELGITWTPLDDTLRDVVKWLYGEGKIRQRQAGTLAT